MAVDKYLGIKSDLNIFILFFIIIFPLKIFR